MPTHFLIALRVFALFAFAFSPAMAFLVFVALLTHSTWWFVFLGLPTLIVNALLVWLQPGRSLFDARIRAIKGSR